MCQEVKALCHNGMCHGGKVFWSRSWSWLSTMTLEIPVLDHGDVFLKFDSVLLPSHLTLSKAFYCFKKD